MRFVLSETFNFRAASRNVFQEGDCFDATRSQSPPFTLLRAGSIVARTRDFPMGPPPRP